MGKKNRRTAADPGPEAKGPSRRTVVFGVLALFASAIVAMVAITAIFGGPLLGDSASPQAPASLPPTPSPEELALVPPTTGTNPLTPLEPAVSALLRETAWSALTPEQRATIRDALKAVFGGGSFRVSSNNIIARDVFRLLDVTRASREYTNPQRQAGNIVLSVTTAIYCDSLKNPNQLETTYFREQDGKSSTSQIAITRNGAPFMTTLTALLWGDVVDLGLRDIDGRQARGYAAPVNRGDGTYIDTENWFDVETGQLVQRRESNGAEFVFDWRTPAPIVLPQGATPPGCLDSLYRAIPAAKPPGYVSPPTATPGAATPAATAVATPPPAAAP